MMSWWCAPGVGVVAVLDGVSLLLRCWMVGARAVGSAWVVLPLLPAPCVLKSTLPAVRLRTSVRCQLLPEELMVDPSRIVADTVVEMAGIAAVRHLPVVERYRCAVFVDQLCSIA